MSARLFAGWKTIHWVFLGLGLIAVVLVVGAALFLSTLAVALDTDRDLKDFESPEQARDFVSGHLPSPLPPLVAVDALHYERWQDWHLRAQVRFDSAATVSAYVDQIKASRLLNDAYCGEAEPGGGARYFLKPSFACCSATPTPTDSLVITCGTR